MCVIIDTNLAARVLIQDDPEFEPVKAHLFRNKKPRVQIAYGGRLVEELFANLEIRRVMARLVRLGRAKQVRDEKIEEEQRRLLRLGICTSNDIHVIALARAAPARVLISLDRGLHRDFTTKDPCKSARQGLSKTQACEIAKYPVRHRKFVSHQTVTARDATLTAPK